jgi:hypothetical protein
MERQMQEAIAVWRPPRVAFSYSATPVEKPTAPMRRALQQERTMLSMKSSIVSFAATAVVGLGFGLGWAQSAQSATPTCRGICTIEYQECLSVPPPYGSLAYCRPIYLRCIAACPR